MCPAGPSHCLLQVVAGQNFFLDLTICDYRLGLNATSAISNMTTGGWNASSMISNSGMANYSSSATAWEAMRACPRVLQLEVVVWSRPWLLSSNPRAAMQLTSAQLAG